MAFWKMVGLDVTPRMPSSTSFCSPPPWMLGRVIFPRSSGSWHGWFGDHHGTARDGHFEVHGLDPDAETPVYFFEPKRELGATVSFSSKSIVASAIAGITVYCANVEVPMKWRIDSPSRDSRVVPSGR